jgi:hypothetical protein
MGKPKNVKTKRGKSGKAEADALDEARQDAESKQSAADEREALGKDDTTPAEESDGDGEEIGKQNAIPKGKQCITKSPIAGEGAASARLLSKFCRGEWKSEQRSTIKNRGARSSDEEP